MRSEVRADTQDNLTVVRHSIISPTSSEMGKSLSEKIFTKDSSRLKCILLEMRLWKRKRKREGQGGGILNI